MGDAGAGPGRLQRRGLRNGGAPPSDRLADAVAPLEEGAAAASCDEDGTQNRRQQDHGQDELAAGPRDPDGGNSGPGSSTALRATTKANWNAWIAVTIQPRCSILATPAPNAAITFGIAPRARIRSSVVPSSA